ncbi:response regulator [Gracilibacillus sp. S3-1-1]|uniref:Response regulator n=1 Tax=Gracilibacillus pellucidus TaxID=3095368 RepID=A0ACC6M0H2_9BACI|nr:response regulator [Gracilibacillus sp. S3-1-1]MDX8044387.1 response regulator [Gracilibacillus sp. S3-1-1]
MSKNRYRVMIVEDDFRVADINKQFVEKVKGFEVVGVAYTGAEALALLENDQALPDLILLDVYIPDVEGLTLMWEIRKRYPTVDIMMVTAAQEAETIEQIFRVGIFDYIIKPVNFERLKQALERYLEKQKLFGTKKELTQEELDDLRKITPVSTKKNEKLPKGIDKLTMRKVMEVIQESNEEGYTAVEVGRQIGASRSTARRYLEYLVSLKRVKAELHYGEVGRPERRYVAN